MDIDLKYKLEQYSAQGYVPFHMPGHKRHMGEGFFGDPSQIDITEIDGFDNLHHAVGILKEAQEQAAAFYGVRRTFFSINGSTACLLAAVYAAVPQHGRILMARNCHKAGYAAVSLREADAVYVWPQELDGSVMGPVDAEAICAQLDSGRFDAVLITSPTYDGVVSDIRHIADVVHAHDTILIVDEAHGAHFCMSDFFPESAVSQGADLVIQSLHKTLPSLTQTALLHVCSARLAETHVSRYMSMFQTSSPSYILMSSITTCLNWMGSEGREAFDRYERRLTESRIRLRKLTHLQLIEIQGADPTKLLIGTTHAGMTGWQLYELLLRRYHIQLEMAAPDYATALSSVADTPEDLQRLCEALEEIDGGGITLPQPEAVGTRVVPAQMVGRAVEEFVYLYPPGIPLLVPGEVMTDELAKEIRRDISQGLTVVGI